MLKKLMIALCASLITACAPVLDEATQSDEISSSVNAVQISYTELTDAGKRVHIKPVASLQPYNGCVEVIILSYRVNLPYQNAMIELRNRGGLMGANAVGISDFVEIDGQATKYVGHFHKCANLSKI